MTTDLITQMAKAFGVDYETLTKDYQAMELLAIVNNAVFACAIATLDEIIGYNPQLLLEDRSTRHYNLWGEDWSAEDFQKNLQKLLDDWHDEGKPWKTSSTQYHKEFLDDDFIDFHADTSPSAKALAAVMTATIAPTGRLSYPTLNPQNLEKRFVIIDVDSYSHHALSTLVHETRGPGIFDIHYTPKFDTKPDVKQNGRSASYLKHDKTKRHKRTRR